MFSKVYLRFQGGTLYAHGFFFPDGIDPIGTNIYIPTVQGRLEEVGKINDLILTNATAYLADSDLTVTNGLDLRLAAVGWHLETFADLFHKKEEKQKEPPKPNVVETNESPISMVHADYFASTISCNLLLPRLREPHVALTSRYNGFPIGIRRMGDRIRLAEATKQELTPEEFKTLEIPFEELEDALINTRSSTKPGALIRNLVADSKSATLRSLSETYSFLGISTFVYPPKQIPAKKEDDVQDRW